METKLHLCKVCGLDLGEDYFSWGVDGRTPTFDFCPCCGVEFGYQDATEKAIVNFRAQWISKGCTWDEPHLKPADWHWEEH